MTDTTARPVPRWRPITYGVLMVLLLFLYLGDRPQQLAFLVTAFGDLSPDQGATHEIHFLAQGVLAWVIVAAIAVQVRRPTMRIGALWVHTLGLLLAFTLLLVLADLPAEVVPILAGAIVLAALGFFAHPAALRDKLRTVAPPSVVLLALTGIAGVVWVVYAFGQFDIHAASGPQDEHHQFGHWVVMGAYGLLVPLFAAVAGLKVTGWRFPLWVAGLMSVALGIGSLAISAVSQLSTFWALLAIVWGAGFIGVGELEARQTEPAREPSASPASR